MEIERKWIHILTEEERQAYLFIIEQIRLATRDLKEANEDTLSTSDLVGLYNAYNCINYQIELDYNKSFIKDMQKLIADKIVQKIEDNYNTNYWEY